MSVPDLDVPTSTFSAEPCARRVIEETETPSPCGCVDWTASERPDTSCRFCHGTGTHWKVTSRRIQIGVPFEEQAAHAYIKGLHAHIRKAAQSMLDAAKDFAKLGHQQQAKGCEQAAKAILEPVEGQD